MTEKQIFTSRNVVLPGHPHPVPAAVTVENGRISAVDSSPTLPEGTLDLGEKALLPGNVDIHVHVNEPGHADWEGFEAATRAAAAGGITTFIDMPLNSIPLTLDVASLNAKQEAAAQKCLIDVGFWGGVIPSSLGELTALHGAGVFGFKAFMISSVANYPALSLDDLSEAARTLAGLDSLLLVHAESEEHLLANPSSTQKRYHEYEESRPHASETEAIRRAIEIAEDTQVRLHIVHLSSAEALPLIEEAKGRGVRVTAETCPHYLVFASEDIPDGATEYKCAPPIRDSKNRERLWGALESGVLDCIATDHAPCSTDMRAFAAHDFALGWAGINSIQVALPAVWTAARERGYNIADVSRWMSQRPADLIRLTDKGQIRVGAPADLVVFDTEAVSTLSEGDLLNRHKDSPYVGLEMRGAVVSTWLSGDPVGIEPKGGLLSRPA